MNELELRINHLQCIEKILKEVDSNKHKITSMVVVAEIKDIENNQDVIYFRRVGSPATGIGLLECGKNFFLTGAEPGEETGMNNVN